MTLKKIILRVVFYFLIALLLVAWLIPLLFCLFTAIKSNQAFFQQSVFSLPDKIEWANFTNAIVVLHNK